MYKFFLLDADMTLFDFDRAEKYAWFETMKIYSKITPDDLMYDFYHDVNAGLWKKFERGETTKDSLVIERHRQVFRRYGVDADPIVFNECYLDKHRTEEIMDNTEKKVFDILQKRNTGDIVNIKDIVVESLESIEAAARNKGSVTGVPTGFYDLDYKTAGLQPSDLVLIAARPSMGKTAFALNIAENVAIKNNIPTVIFSLEMSKDQLVKRIMAMYSRINSQALRTGDLTDDEWVELVETSRIIGNSNLVIDDTPGISVSELRSKCRKLKLEKNIGLVIIDYLQLMVGSSKRVESRQQEISEISRSLKALAREIDAPVVALSQ